MTALFIIAALVLIMSFYFYKKNPRSKECNNIGIKNDGTIRFYVDRADPEEIKHCESGDSVRLWMPSEDPKRILIYREGTFMGAGRIGYVPDEHFEKIAPNVGNDRAFTAKIIEKAESYCKIEYRKKTTEETFSEISTLIDQLEKTQENFQTKITKKYKPKKPVEVFLYVSGGIKIRANEKLSIKFESLDTYLVQEPPTIEFVNEDNKTIGTLAGKDAVYRILKAHFNDYKFDIEILDVPRLHTKYSHPIRLLVKHYL